MTDIVVVTDFNDRGDSTLYGLTVGSVSLLFEGINHD